MPNYRKELLDAKKAYKAKDYEVAYEIYSNLYGEAPFDNSTRYSYAWTIYQLKIRDYQSRDELMESAELVTELTRQNNLNFTKMCVYTMSVFKVLKLLYYEREYDELPHWLEKINPDLLDQVRYNRNGEMYPSNMESYYVWASVTYLKLEDYEKCIDVSRSALSKLNKFTHNNAEFFQWRLAKSLRQIGEYEQSLKFLKIIQLDEWYIDKEIAENYYALNDKNQALEHAVKAALKGGPMDMKYNLYRLIAEILYETDLEMALKHDELCDLILNEESEGKIELESELVDFWNVLVRDFN